MAVTNIVHDDDFGFVITVTFISRVTGLALDISGATTRRIDIRNTRTGVVNQNAATFVTDGTDGQLQYTTVAADFADVGLWEVQGVALSVSVRFATDVADINVRRNLVDV